jgi:hypothetical protein
MEPNTRTPAGSNRLRPLNKPRPIQVRVGLGGRPQAVELHGRWRSARVEEVWRVEDSWWRRPVGRTYFRLALEEGRGSGSMLIVYWDQVERSWWRQPY